MTVCIIEILPYLCDADSLKSEPDDSYFNRLEELQKEYVLL